MLRRLPTHSLRASGPMVRRTLALALLALASACGPFLPETDGVNLEVQRRALATARQRWEGVRPAAYTFVIRRQCQACTAGLVTVTVRDGALQSATTEAGETPPAWYLTGFRTVDEVFATVEATLDRRPHALDTRYRPAIGYPVRVTADPQENAIDEEWGIEIIRLDPLDGQR